MKKCSYCGKEYPDDATACVIDTEPLFDPSKPPVEEKPPIKQEPPPKPKPAKADPNLVYPDYQWLARDAWKCMGIIIALSFVLFAFSHLQFLIFPAFYRSVYGYVSDAALHYGVEILVAAYFARTETLKTFYRGFGLDCKPTNYVWFGLVMILTIRFISHYMLVHGWGKGVHNYDFTSFRNTIGPKRFLFLITPVIMAPFFEECLYRGFLYKAFRGSYPVAVSMILIVAWTFYAHWFYHKSWIAGLDLTAFAIVLCYLREKSLSLWDCIVCHFVYNASLLFIGNSS